MAFFKSKPNVGDGEKARIEFHLQQLLECLGESRFQLPVIGMPELYDQTQATKTPEQFVGYLGKHLGHDTDGITVVVQPGDLTKCGSGG